MKYKKHLFFAIAFIPFIHLFSMVRLPRIISDNMVIQQNAPVKIWGWADPNEKVLVSINNQVQKTKADQQGNWQVILTPEKQGGPYSMTITGKNTITIKNILIGEVWLCSGQSNMEWTMSQIEKNEDEINDANFNEIRFFNVPQNVQFNPVDDIPAGEWKVITPANVEEFSAVAYYFGKNIYQKYKFPIGLISSSWGGTDIETWMSKEAIASTNLFDKNLEKLSLVNPEEIKKETEAKRNKIKSYMKSETDGIIDGKPFWANIELDESDWDTIYAPRLWEQTLLPDMDGVVWFRKTIHLTKEQISSDITVHLGKIDDSDMSWINGVSIGQTTNKYNLVRRYRVPSSYLKEGKNVITVRVEDTGGGGGFWGESNDFKIETATGKIPLEGFWKFKLTPIKFRINNASYSPNQYPTLLYNGMINPIKNYTTQGVIWYQGENNADRAYTYQTLFPLMITDWRKQLNNPNLSFLYVQLANFMPAKETPQESTWAELREAQNKALTLPKVGTAITIDIGDANDIHPRNKKDVGYRLSLAARKITYGDTVTHSGPVYQSMVIDGNKAILTFSQMGRGLKVKNKYGYLMGFQVAGEDKQFYWAKAWLENNKVILYSEQVKNPMSVRYAWSDNPEDANLYNKEGLPASPFRTDNWPGITK